jgi:hypothetical protein
LFNAEEHLTDASNWFRKYILEELGKRRAAKQPLGEPAQPQPQPHAHDNVENAQPATERPLGETSVNVSSIRERIGKLRKDYVKPVESAAEVAIAAPDLVALALEAKRAPTLPDAPVASSTAAAAVVTAAPAATVATAAAATPADVLDAGKAPAGSGLTTLESIRERMAARRKAAATISF